jgi:iron complex transport system substrate-binding protein
MAGFNKTFFILILFVLFNGCKNKDTNQHKILNSEIKLIKYATGFSISKYNGFSVLKVSNPWPKANRNYIYVLKEKYGIVPDSLAKNTIINIPVKTIIATSTTHIPSLEMLGVQESLIGFPHLDYISSPKIRAQIDAKKIKELGQNQDLNIERVIDLNPSVIIGYGIDNNNPGLENLEKSGLKVILNGDWNEQTPLGKAEWIKFFGALYGLDNKALHLFNAIENEYIKTVALAKKATFKPTVLSGDMYEGVWYMPQGNSWGSQILKQAQANYLWQDSKGTGSLFLSFETVFDKAQNADFWFTSGQFSSLKSMEQANKHYSQFKAFQNKKVYSFANKKGATGGVLFYELAPNRPDIVLKDIVKILHPDLLPDHKLYFFEQLK